MKVSCYDKNGESIGALYQWDTNITIVIQGLSINNPPLIKFHFSNTKKTDAYVVTPTQSGIGFAAVIPNELFLTPDVILLYIYENDPSTGEGRTIADARITVIPRQKPQDYAYVPTVVAKSLVDGLTFMDGKLYLTASGKIVGEGISIDSEKYAFSVYNTSSVSDGDILGTVIGTAEEV